MTAITATAQCGVRKVGHWFNRRYIITLYVNSVNTGLSWDVKRRQVDRMCEVAVDNCAELLEHYGLMDAVYELVEHEELDFPAQGSKVKLKAELGELKAGTVGTVTGTQWDNSVSADNQYPLQVAFTTSTGTQTIPMAINEVEAV